MPGTHRDAARPLRVAKLVRVSTAHLEQADSPQHQLAYIGGEVDRQGWQDTGLVYRAELTGAVIIHRPEIQRLLADAEAGHFDALVLKSISRLGRDTLGLLMVKRVLDDLGVELVALSDGYRSFRDPELIFLVHAERAQAGRQEISKAVRAGIVEAARRGIWPGGVLPFGLRREGRLRIGIDLEAAAVVRLIFQLRARRWGLTRICQHLNHDRRIKAPAWWRLRAAISRLESIDGGTGDPRVQDRLQRLRARLAAGGFLWSPRTLRLLLANTAYRGELRYNRTAGQRRLHGRLERTLRDPAEWVTVPCPALVSRAEWEAAQLTGATPRCTGDRPPGGVRAAVRGWLLSGLARCGRCGGPMRAVAARGNTGRRGGEPRGYYVCRAGLEQRLHPRTYVRATILERAVLQRLRAALAGALPDAGGTAAHTAAPRRRSRRRAAARARLQARLQDLAEARFYRRELLRRGQMTPAEFATEAAILQRQEAELRSQWAQLEAGEPPAGESPATTGTASTADAAAAAMARLMRLEGSDGDLRALLPLLVRRVVVHGGEAADLYVTFAPDEGAVAETGTRAGAGCAGDRGDRGQHRDRGDRGHHGDQGAAGRHR